jgi:hypothetical protein
MADIHNEEQKARSKIAALQKEWEALGAKRNAALEGVLEVMGEEDRRKLPRKLRAVRKISKNDHSKRIALARFYVRETSCRKKYDSLVLFRDILLDEERVAKRISAGCETSRVRLAELAKMKAKAQVDRQQAAVAERAGTPQRAVENRKKITGSGMRKQRVSGDDVLDAAPQTPPDAALSSITAPAPSTPPQSLAAQLEPINPVSIHFPRIADLAGTWSVMCGPQSFGVNVSAEGVLDMWSTDEGDDWSSRNIRVAQKRGNFQVQVNGLAWDTAGAEGRNILTWRTPSHPGLVSRWTRQITSRPAVKAKPKARVQAKAAAAPPQYSQAHSVEQPAATTGSSFHTVLRDGILVWTDGTDMPGQLGPQKSKMQF